MATKFYLWMIMFTAFIVLKQNASCLNMRYINLSVCLQKSYKMYKFGIINLIESNMEMDWKEYFKLLAPDKKVNKHLNKMSGIIKEAHKDSGSNDDDETPLFI